jgi:hypothetical protein
MQIPAVGTQVVVVIENLSRVRSWDPHTLTFEGAIAPKFKWLDMDEFCLTTGDPGFPIRSIKQGRVVSITVNGQTVENTPADKATPPKTGVWQVQGSKGDFYTVSRNGDRWTCSCVAGGFGRMCKHAKSMQAKEAV